MKTGISWLDVKLGGRMLVKHPGLSLVGGLGMAVAIAISVGFFAFLSAHVYPVLPLDEGDRIVALENRDLEIDNEERQSLHDFVAWRGELKSIDHLAAFRTVDRTLITGEGPPEPVSVAEMTAAGFQVARVAPLLGRTFVEEDERVGAPAVVVIGHEVWKERFGGDRAVVGRDLRLGATVHTVVGVMPEGFGFPQNHQYWTPLRADPVDYARRQGPAIFIFGRLAPGVTMKEAQAELAVIGERTAAAFPETHARLRPMVMPYTHSLTDIQGTTTWMVAQMQLMMSLLLLVVALNVAILVYARTAARQGEIAVRTALGASRGRVIGQLFVEALVLSLGAAACGLALAQLGVQLGNRLMEMEMGVPFWADYRLRPSTILYTVGVAVVAAVIVGVLPAQQVTGRRLQTDLRQLGGGTGMRLGKTWTALVVAQVAIAVAALPAAFNMGWTEIRHATTRPLFPTGEFMAAELGAEFQQGGAAAPADSTRFGDRLGELLRRLQGEPGVAGATYQAGLPGRSGHVEVQGAPAPPESPAGHKVSSAGVGPGFLEMYGARILQGRALQPADMGPDAPAVVVNETFVKRVLGGGPALGRRVRYAAVPPATGPGPAQPGPWHEIVGVAADLHANRLNPELVPAGLLYPVPPARAREVTVEVRLRGTTPAAFAPRLREIAVAVDPELQLGTTYSLDEVEGQEKLAVRLIALVIGLVLLSVFLLSAAGVYALTSFTVTQRRREIGIRAALGAHPRQVLASVFARVAGQIALGLVVGIAAAAALDRALGGELMGGRAAVLLPAFGLMMILVALLAAVGPARRGLSIQPMEALREQ